MANFAEILAPASTIVGKNIALLKEASINEVYILDNISEPICQIPVGVGSEFRTDRKGQRRVIPPCTTDLI